MLAFRLLTATALFLLAVAGARAEGSSALNDCKRAAQLKDLDGAVAACERATVSAQTPEDEAIAMRLLVMLQSARVRRDSVEKPTDYTIVIDPQLLRPAALDAPGAIPP